ncbi:hypothetical protein H5410_040570 [Solanum commersonii]|uniref:Uncharacterized protein n=1 Tax=Solanum commersonii TaxID=4109 RepID=A0A9J5XSC7_SOLCO|nr:hypothetical protein H5410_040570 [Solanum commersonii]
MNLFQQQRTFTLSMVPQGLIKTRDGRSNSLKSTTQGDIMMWTMTMLQVRDYAKLSATTFHTFKTPIYFLKAHLPSTDLPNQLELTQHTPTHGRILRAHVIAPYEQHVPPVYSTGAPTFKMPVVVLRKALKSLQVTRGIKSLDYDDLCIHPHIDMPVGYKQPKFDTFDGKGDPHAHLRAYCDKLVGVGRNEKLRMKWFIQSLSGETLISFSLVNIQKKPSENFQEYARRWRTEAAMLQPPLDESKFSNSYVPHQGYNTQPHYNPPRAPTYKNPPSPYVPVQEPTHQNKPAYAPRPHPNLEARNDYVYTHIAEPYVQLFERLRTVGVLQPVEGKLLDPIPHNFDGNKGVIKCTPASPNVNNNPLPNHENWEVNIVTLGEEYEVLDCLDIDELDAMTSSAQPVIIVQLREPLTVKTYLLRVVVTTLIARKPEYDTKSNPMGLSSTREWQDDRQCRGSWDD